MEKLSRKVKMEKKLEILEKNYNNWNFKNTVGLIAGYRWQKKESIKLKIEQ